MASGFWTSMKRSFCTESAFGGVVSDSPPGPPRTTFGAAPEPTMANAAPFAPAGTCTVRTPACAARAVAFDGWKPLKPQLLKKLMRPLHS